MYASLRNRVCQLKNKIDRTVDRSSEKRALISIRLPESLVKDIRSLAKTEGLSQGALVERLILNGANPQPRDRPNEATRTASLDAKPISRHEGEDGASQDERVEVLASRLEELVEAFNKRAAHSNETEAAGKKAFNSLFNEFKELKDGSIENFNRINESFARINSAILQLQEAKQSKPSPGGSSRGKGFS